MTISKYFVMAYMTCKGRVWILSPKGEGFKLKEPNTMNL